MDDPIDKPIYEGFKIGPKFSKKLGPKKPRSKSRGSLLTYLKTIRKNRTGALTKINQKLYKGTQKSVVKASYLANKYPNQWRAHGRYLQREGAQKIDERGVGFDQKSDQVQIAKVLESWQKAGDVRLWKIIISPEQAHKMDLKDHARAVIKQMEDDLETKLEVACIDHYNTANYHVHVVIRGKRDNGQDLLLDKDYIRNGIRQRSQEIATKELGLRIDRDVLQRRNRAIELKHVTELDREIKSKLDQESKISLNFETKSSVELEKRLQILGRLTFLKSLHLADRIDANSWHVDPGFVEFLRYQQLEKDIIKGRDQHTNRDLPLLFNKLPEVGQELVGKVIGWGFSEYQNESRYLLIEGIDGQNHYVTATLGVAKKRDLGDIQKGDIIYLQRREFEKSGKKISFIYSDAVKGFEDIRDSKEINHVDVHILNTIQKSGEIPLAGELSTDLRKEFSLVVQERVEYLKRTRVLNDKLDINRAQLERQLKLNKSLGQSLNLDRSEA